MFSKIRLKTVATAILILTHFGVVQADEPEQTFIQSVEINSEDFPTPDIDIHLDISDVWHFKSLEAEVTCLAKNIYWEGRQEPEQGQIAVGLVTINRLKTQQYADSICKVVYQKFRNRRGHFVAQFSWSTMKVAKRPPRNIPEWEHCLELARNFLANKSLDNVDDFTKGATYYHAAYVHPKWRFDYEVVIQIGVHIFYRDREEARLAQLY